MNGLSLIGIAVMLWVVGSSIIAKNFTVPALMWYPIASAIATIVTGSVLARVGSLKQLWPENKMACWFLILSGFSVVLTNGLFFTAFQYASVPVAQLTHYFAPLLLAMVFAPLLLREKPTVRETVITVVGLIGLVVVLWPDLSQSTLSIGALLGLGSAVTFALGTVINRKAYVYGVTPFSLAVWHNIVPAVVMAPFIFYFMKQGVHFTSNDWLGVAYMGIFAIGIGFILYMMGLQRVAKANHAAIMTYGEPIGAIILAAIFMGEPMTVYVVVGGVLIIGSGIALVAGNE